MKENTAIKIFGDKSIRTFFDEDTGEWYFSIIDVVEALTGSPNPRDYWFRMKQRVKLEDGIELSTLCRQLKLVASDGKKYNTDCANLDNKTGKSVVTDDNFLPPSKNRRLPPSIKPPPQNT